MEVFLLLAALFVGLLMIPFGLPGLWVMVGAVLVYSSWGPPNQIGITTVVIVALLAAAGEVLEFILTGRVVKKYGGSRRAGWGAIIGSIVGAFMGVPVPLIGSMIGAFLGAFVGAWVAEITNRAEWRTATRVATGALIGRVAAVGGKVGIGCAVVVWVAFALVLGH